MKKNLLIPILAVIALFVLVNQTFYTLREDQQAVITRFGKVIGETEKKAGLKIKAPFIDTVHIFSKKVISWDGSANLLPTSDDKRILLDTTARWYISNPKKFYTTLSSFPQAYNKLDNIIDSRVRTVIGRYSMDEIVRTSNTIISDQDDREKVLLENLNNNNSPESYFIINKIIKGRTLLSDEILELSRKEINSETIGIELIDFLVRQVQYPEAVEQKAYKRMSSERKKKAARQRSTGEGEKAKWQGRLEKDKKTILAKAEAEASRIYREAYDKDPDFYKFWRAMESYKNNLNSVNKTLSTDMAYFDYLYNPSGKKR